MSTPPEERRTPGKASSEPEGAPPPVVALTKITILLRHIDDELAALRHEGDPDRLLSVVEDAPELTEVLGPLEDTLSEAARRLGIEPAPIDVRQRVWGPLHILWADLVEMSPERLRKQWGADDVPEAWPGLQRQLLAAVEHAIAALGRQPEPRAVPPPGVGP